MYTHHQVITSIILMVLSSLVTCFFMQQYQDPWIIRIYKEKEAAIEYVVYDQDTELLLGHLMEEILHIKLKPASKRH